MNCSDAFKDVNNGCLFGSLIQFPDTYKLFKLVTMSTIQAYRNIFNQMKTEKRLIVDMKKIQLIKDNAAATVKHEPKKDKI